VNASRAITLQVLAGRLRSELKLKLVIMFVLNLLVYVPYYLLQRHPVFRPTVMRLSFCDRLIPFVDKAVWIYLSIYLLMPIGPYLMTRRQEIRRYAVGVVLIGAIADLIFFFWPTLCPRPATGGATAAYRLLTVIDNPSHAFPSLHAAFAVYSALCAGQVLRELSAHAIWRGAIWFWAFCILVATLLTRQHVIADLAAGAALGFGVHFCVFHRRRPDSKANISYSSVTAKTTQSNPTVL
jgi:membrane-associated phospholipid phosphatase